jgi:predicted nucleotidyltransferase
MKPSELLSRNRDAIVALTKKHRTENPRVFGSVSRGEDTERSDLDLLVDPLPETTLLHLIKLENELADLLGTKVDLLTPNGLSKYLRAEVLREARAL